MTTAVATPPASVSPPAPVALAEFKPKRKRPTIGLILACTFLVTLVLMAIFADFLPFIRYPDEKVYGPGGARPKPYNWGPSSTAWFGTDRLAQDIFAKCIYGARTTLQVGIYATIFGILVGGLLGVLAGYFRKGTDRAVSIFTDCLLAIPALLLSMILISRLDDVRTDTSWLNWFDRKWQLVFTLGILAVAPLSRIVRAQTLSLREREFVLAARSVGAKPTRVIFREIMPNLIPAIMTVAFTGLSIIIAAEGALAFLGLGVEIGTPTWGKLINENRNSIETAWWAVFFPCMMLFLTVYSFNIIGDRLSRRFDIRQAGV